MDKFDIVFTLLYGASLLAWLAVAIQYWYYEIYKKHKCIVERHLAEKTTIREDYRYHCWCNRIQGNFFRKLKRQFELFVQDKLLYKDYRLNARDKVIKLLMLCLIQEYPIIAKIRWSKTLKFYDSEDIDN